METVAYVAIHHSTALFKGGCPATITFEFSLKGLLTIYVQPLPFYMNTSPGIMPSHWKSLAWRAADWNIICLVHEKEFEIWWVPLSQTRPYSDKSRSYSQALCLLELEEGLSQVSSGLEEPTKRIKAFQSPLYRRT